MEKLVFNHLYNFCRDNKILTWRNSGFKPLDSAINQLVYITHKIYKYLDEGREICMVYLDITKAFERVWHVGLLHKLEMYGTDGNLHRWLKDYLTNRKQRVVLNGVASEWRNVGAGVPQGSILGPLLFLFFLNDIIDDVGSDIFLYADDSCLMKVINDPVNSIYELNSDLETISNWANRRAVNVSAPKCNYMVISRKKHKLDLPPVRFNDHLGVTFTSNMTWHEHIKSKIAKTAKNDEYAYKLICFLPRSCKERIYIAFIRTILEYGCLLYNNIPMYLSHLLENCQRNIAIVCTGAYRHTSHNQITRCC